jgi:hypothetical protein
LSSEEVGERGSGGVTARRFRTFAVYDGERDLGAQAKTRKHL